MLLLLLLLLYLLNKEMIKKNKQKKFLTKGKYQKRVSDSEGQFVYEGRGRRGFPPPFTRSNFISNRSLFERSFPIIQCANHETAKRFAQL